MWPFAENNPRVKELKAKLDLLKREAGHQLNELNAHIKKLQNEKRSASHEAAGEIEHNIQAALTARQQREASFLTERHKLEEDIKNARKGHTLQPAQT